MKHTLMLIAHGIFFISVLISTSGIAEEQSARTLLAEEHFQQEAFADLVALLQGQTLTEREKHFLAIAFRRLNRPKEALPLFKSLAKSPSLDFDYALALFESGLNEEAKELLAPLASLSQENNLKTQAQLVLAKIALDEQRFQEAHQLIEECHPSAVDSNESYEKLFLLGDAAFRQRDYAKSVAWLEQALPKRNQSLAPWTAKTLGLLSKAYVKYAEESSLNFEKKLQLIKKAEEIYLQAFLEYPQQQSPLEVIYFYCTKARLLNDSTALQTGRAILEHSPQLLLPEMKVYAFTLLGDTAYLEGQKKRDKTLLANAEEYYGIAASFLPKDQRQDLFLKQIQALLQEGSLEALTKSNLLIQQIPGDEPRILLLRAELALRGNDLNNQQKALEELELKELAAPYRATQLYLLGCLFYKEKKLEKALQQFSALIQNYPNATYVSEALYWSGRALEKLHASHEKIRSYYQKVYENFPSSPYAAESYFFAYEEQDYLTGERASLKHLHGFKKRFPFSPLLLNALYLEGLDHLRDRRTLEGKYLSRKNLNAAILAFHELETAFDHFHAEGKFLDEELPRAISLKYHAILERAKANFTIANESKNAKRQIYLNYAQEVFQQLKNDFQDPQHPLIAKMPSVLYHPIEEEATYCLALIILERQDLTLAQTLLQAMKEKYEALGISKGYFLAKTHYELGKIAIQENRSREAIQAFESALYAAEPNELRIDERLAILIEKAEALRHSGKFDDAMRQLSEVVNYPAISSQRLKAMYLRATVYADQGRKSLARKQLETLALKNGEWAKKAKETLDKEYGYD